jgi:hypothetical protein
MPRFRGVYGKLQRYDIIKHKEHIRDGCLLKTMSKCQHLAHALGPVDFSGCADCGDRSFPSTSNREVSEEGDRELIVYERMSHFDVW